MNLLRLAAVRVAHENAVIEAGLRHILGAWPEFEVEPPAGSNYFSAVQTGNPDVLIVDHESGIAWARNDLHHTARTKVMIVAMTGQEADVRIALEAGVRGYVLIGCQAEEIVNAVRAVAAGRRHLCSAATLRMADSLSQPTLTMRESEVLALVFRGLNNKEVARSLDISVGTVKSHMRGLLAKLGARCRTEALWIASQRGLITRPEDAASDRAHASGRPSSSGSWATARAGGVRSELLPGRDVLQSAAA
jgi:DNA-binding NarL/FixJ family response regulator